MTLDDVFALKRAKNTNDRPPFNIDNTLNIRGAERLYLESGQEPDALAECRLFGSLRSHGDISFFISAIPLQSIHNVRTVLTSIKSTCKQGPQAVDLIYAVRDAELFMALGVALKTDTKSTDGSAVRFVFKGVPLKQTRRKLRLRLSKEQEYVLIDCTYKTPYVIRNENEDCRH